MKILLKELPDRNLTVLGFQGDRQVADAKYFKGALISTGRTGNPRSR